MCFIDHWYGSRETYHGPEVLISCFALCTQFSSFIIQAVASFCQPPVVCIRTDSGYGVVVSVSDSQKILCTTCKHKKHHCDHVKFVEEMASSIPDADMPDAISEFLHLLHHSSRRKPKKEWCSCVSSSKIPFVLTPSLSEVLNLPTRIRFDVTENVANLTPDLPTNCSGCGSVCAEMVQQSERVSIIILTNSVINAKGIILLLCS